MHDRLRMFSETRAYHKRDEPGPQNYGINEAHTKKSSSKASFGYGKKIDFTQNPELASNPGPVYQLSGFCDKYTKTKFKNLGKKFR